MVSKIAKLLPVLLALSGAFAATINTTLTVSNATVAIAATGVTVAGNASLTGIGSGTFNASAAITSISLTAPTNNIDFTITLSDGTIKGTITIPTALITGGATSGTGSATITGGTGNYNGATGSFPSLTGSVTGSPLSGGTITFTGAGTITTAGSSGGGGAGPTPTVTAVLDAGSYTTNIAQGSIFVVKGTNLSAPGFTQFGFPLPTTSTDGVKITFSPTNGNPSTIAYLIYLFNQNGVNQLAAVLPSTIGIGNYNVIVTTATSNSTGFPVTVVARKFTMLTQDATGSGLATAQNFISATQVDLNRFTTGTISGVTISPAKPGQTVTIYGTGIGPISGADNTGAPLLDQTGTANVQAIVGGTTIKPGYAGRTPGLAGLDQINVPLPANVPTGCTVPVQISVNGVLSPPTFIAIAPSASATACVQPGFTTQQLQSLDNGGSFTASAFVLSQISQSAPPVGTVKVDTLGGSFIRYTGFQLASAAASGATQGAIPSGGSCQVIHVTGSTTQIISGGASLTGLDAGNIIFNGPSGSNISNVALKQDVSNLYSAALGTEGLGIPGGPNTTLTAGKYTLTGAGGKDVGQFTASVTLGSPLTITGGLPATVNRSAGLTLNWTGGNATDTVEVFGYAGSLSGTGASATIDATEFICITTAGAQTLNVPSSILTQLPAVTNSGIATGFLEVVSTPTPASGNGLFSAPLTAGGSIDAGVFLALVGFGAPVTYQ
jgi:uncharacterized protein (TIGR03437 family)